MIGLVAQTLLIAGLLSAAVLVIGPLLRLTPAVRFGLWMVVLIKLLTPPLVEWPWDARALLSAVLPEELRTSTACPECTAAVVAPVDASTLDMGSSVVSEIGGLLGLFWALGSLLVVTLWVIRISRFQFALSASDPAPDRIERLIERVADRLGIRPPHARILPISHGPLVWSLGRPVLVIPQAMLSNEDDRFWRCILAHELAHIRRRDHWFVWLELVGLVVWWWNPLYWLVRRRLRMNAELAADNWAASLHPDSRRSYAEALLWVAGWACGEHRALPALGASHSSRSQFERRLALVLEGGRAVSVSRPGLIGLILLTMVTLPGWTIGQIAPADRPSLRTEVVSASFDLYQNYPNPFHTSTTIPFELHEGAFAADGAAAVSMHIYDIYARFVAHPVALGHPMGEGMEVDRLRYASPGRYEAFWDGTNEVGEPVKKGIYLVQLSAPGTEPLTRKMYVSGPEEGLAADSSKTPAD